MFFYITVWCCLSLLLQIHQVLPFLSQTLAFPSIPAVSHLTSQPTLITSPPPRGSYFLIGRPSRYSIPEINSPPLCYSYYLGVLELAWPSKQTLYSHPPTSSRPYQWSYITAGHGRCPRAGEVNNGQDRMMKRCKCVAGGAPLQPGLFQVAVLSYSVCVHVKVFPCCQTATQPFSPFIPAQTSTLQSPASRGK